MISICHSLKKPKILFSSFFVMRDFTSRLVKNIEKMILRKCVLSMLSMGQREKTKYSTLIYSQ